jgi:hypothetical protein
LIGEVPGLAEVESVVQRGVGAKRGGISRDESGHQRIGLDTWRARGVVESKTVVAARAVAIEVRLRGVERIEEAASGDRINGAGVDLVEVGNAPQLGAAVADVAEFEREIETQLARHAQRPLAVVGRG